MVTVEEVRLDIVPFQRSGSPDSVNLAANASRSENISVVPEKPSDDAYKWKNYGQINTKSATNASGEENISVVLEKPSDDGYNWRKYGQKNIKGNKHTRSYYKCSHQKCLVKKQIERAPDGRIIDTSYFGKHDHPKTQTGLDVALPSILSMKVQIGEDTSSAVAEDKSSSAHALTADDAELKETNEHTPVPMSVEGTNDVASPSTVTKDYGNTEDNVASKRRKTGDAHDMSIDNKSNSKSRWVVETVSAVDIVNDGYRWRKYGQKLVKDNPNARSYYRCTHPGCHAKKRVERASHDPNVVITTYEGNHDHDVPQGRNLFPHSGTPAASIASGHNGVKPEAVILAQCTAAICKEQGNTTDQVDEKGNVPEEVNRAQSSAAIFIQEQGSTDNPAEKDHPPEEGNTTDQVDEKNNVPEVNRAQSSAAIFIQELGSTDNPAEKGHPPEEAYRVQSFTTVKQEGSTIVQPAEKVGPGDEVKQAQNSAAICKQEQGDTIDLPAKKDDTPEEVKGAQNNAAVCEQEKGSTIDQPAEKEDPPKEVDQAESSTTICKLEQGSTTDHPDEKTTHQMI